MFDKDALRVSMRQWTTGVTVVSAVMQGVQHGMTVNSFTSISLEPPLLLVSLSRQARTHALVAASGTFGVTILNETQAEISDRFAGRMPEDQDRFAGLETFTLLSGVPFIEGGLAFFDCQVRHTFPLADHTLFVGEVLALRAALEGTPLGHASAQHAPLIYYNRAYRALR